MTKERLEDLRKMSAPTWEGLSTDGLDEELKKIDPEVEYEVCTGKEMNDTYHLTGTNAYQDNLSIVILTNWSISMMTWKLKYGCRWLDDVIDNNIQREKENKRR